MQGQDETLDDTKYARSGLMSPMGKCTAEVKVRIPEALKDEAEAAASRLGTNASEIGRDLFFMWLRGMTYGEYVADSRRASLQGEVPEKGLQRFQNLRVVGEVKA